MKWLGRILLGLVALLMVLVLLSYLFRARITDRAVNYLNILQPGEVSMASINLRPFMDFPNVSVRLKALQYSARTDSAAAAMPPVVRLDEVFVALDIVKLIRGQYKISSVRLGDGEINYLVGADSISNVEKALGIRFGEAAEADSVVKDSSRLTLDLESLQIRNLQIHYHDIPSETRGSLRMNGLQSGFSYGTDLVTAAVMMHADITSAAFAGIDLDKPKTFSFSTSLRYDQVGQRISLDRSMLDLQYAFFEIGGDVDLREESVDLQFSASNSGIELLNFLLNGIMDLQALEQTGEGKMKIDGQVSGSYADNLPRIDINFSAEEMAFTVHAVNQSVNGIRFEGFATNGGRQDLSEAALRISNFHVAFPTGTVEADLEVSNLRSPEIRLMIEGGVDLAIIDEILDNASVHSMDGHVRIAGEVDGTVDLEAGNFSEGGGGIGISAEEASFLVAGHAVQALNGTFYMDDKTFEARQIGMQIDGNDLRFSITAGGLLPYLLNIPAHPWVTVELAADELFLDKILGDTLLPGPVRNFSLEAGVSLADSELDRVLHNGAIPVAVMDIRHLGFLVPGYAPVSDLRLVLNLEEERMVLSEMHVASGESRLAFGMELENYRAFLAGDSAAVLTLLFDLDAEQLLARDLLTVKDTFSLLPAYFEGEEIADLKFKGKVKTTVGEVLDTSKIPNVEFICENLQWELKGYPHGFRNFSADVELVDSLLIVNGFRGTVGENNIDLRASVLHLMDSTKTISGSMDIRSSLLDFDQLLDYPLLTGTVGDTVSLGEEGLALPEDSIVEAVPGIGDFDFPGLELTMDMEELRYGELDFRNLRGKIEVVPEKMVYLDHFFVQTVSGGSFLVDGTFDVADPEHYTFVSSIEIDTVNVSDFDLQFAMEDSIYSLEDNFNGLLSTDATVEMFINPDFSIDLESTTARFDVVLRDGRVKNFAPLHAIAKYTGNKDLDNVKFGELRNGMSITLAEGVIKIPLMSIESTLGLILIEGEQSLAGDFLYLVRVPTRLIRGTARNMLSGQQRREEEAEDEIQTMKAQKFAVLTVYGKGETVEVKMGDKREDY